ncbi:MAG: hypothetical protein K8J08_03825 [Thermoanaerobaculia bacterium]|nr:hypothetical protein [Thermoanaerobaculia bacterium]
MNPLRRLTAFATTLILLILLVPAIAAAHDPDFTISFDRDRCTFTSTGSNPYFPLWPGYTTYFEGEELDDEEELVEIANRITVLADTELVDGVVTRVLEERESEDGEIVEISRNFMAYCRETGDVWYFGEDVDIYEDGEIISHDGAWRAGVDGAKAGILMPGTPLIGARHYQEVAPGIALDRAEIVSVDDPLSVPYQMFDETVFVTENSPLDEGIQSTKWYASGIGLVKDGELELVDIVHGACQPDEHTLCLNDGRFRVVADWTDFLANEGDATAQPLSNEAGQFWFFGPDNVELIVKVIDACGAPDFNSFWFFAAGLTNVELTIEVTDTMTGITNEYENGLGENFAPVLDTAAFATCP